MIKAGLSLGPLSFPSSLPPSRLPTTRETHGTQGEWGEKGRFYCHGVCQDSDDGGGGIGGTEALH